MSGPIFVVGVPRSGTTLVRMMLDAHPELSAGPETPWLSADPELPSLEALADFLCKAPAGIAGHTGVGPPEVHAACAAFVESLLGASALARGRSRWVNKTPKNLLHLPFLARLFPRASVVHVLRDGRDVALSTSRTRWKTLDMGPSGSARSGGVASSRARNTFRNALRRWDRWLERLDRDAPQLPLPLVTLRYERLVSEPEPTLRELCGEIGLAWDPALLDPYGAPHDAHPRAREGTTSFVQAGRIMREGAYRWRRELSFPRRLAAWSTIEGRLHALGYPPTLGSG